jgi:cell division protein FtsI (penicillin-binding protein 3)
MVEILRKVVEQGTGREAALAGVEIVGKTGTAQKADPRGGYSKDKCVASFVGALMSIRPRVVILVVIDEPSGDHPTGGKVAAPVFRKVAEGVLALCGTRPTDAAPILQDSGDVHRTKVHSAYRSLKVRKGPKPGEWIVPDLKGMDMRQVLEVCGTIRCDASFKGVGYAVTQDPGPGSVLKEGASLSVAFGGHS